MLSSPPIGATPARLGAADPARPSHSDALLARERAAAYEAGVAAGRAQAAAAQRAQLEAVATELREAVDEQVARWAAARVAHDRSVLDVAARIARYVVDLVDASAVDALVDRLRAAVEELDDVDLTAHVAPAQVDAVADALAPTGVRVVADANLDAGDGRLVGRWSVADVGQQRRWDAVKELVDRA